MLDRLPIASYAALLCLCLIPSACGFIAGVHPVGNETELRAALARKTGVIRMAAGVIEVSAPLEIPAGSENLELGGDPSGTILRASGLFDGRAVIDCRSARNIRLADFSVAGNRPALEKAIALPPSNRTFADFYSRNGIVAEDVETLTIENVKFSEITNYAVIVSASRKVLIERVEVKDSGSRNERGRNNASGGILIENGTSDFTVRGCKLENIRGNGIWTHSRYESPRNSDGLIVENRFFQVGRDAIQIGHATRIRVERNSGSHIGYPVEEVDVEGGAMPVAIDTAGNTDASVYLENSFEEINGKCIDLDGFHHGEVSRNRCVNQGEARAYPSGHFGIVMNNTNPDMQSEDIVISDNLIDGAVYGGMFVIGSGHRIVGNRLKQLNKAACRHGSADPRCHFWPQEPTLLESGIYLGSQAERPAVTFGNTIENNEISGFGMADGCLGISPSVDRSANRIHSNVCRDESAAR